MDEINFRNWLAAGETKKKVQGDCISRLKRIERELKLDLDKKYEETNLEDILEAFSNMGRNAEMEKYGEVNLPVGKYYMSTYRHSLKMYSKFKNGQ